MGDEQSGTPADASAERAAAVAATLAEIIAMVREYELPSWERALEHDRRRVIAGEVEVYAVLRYRLDGRYGLSEVRMGFGDRALNARLDGLRIRLRNLLAEAEAEAEPMPVAEEPVDPGPAQYGVRVEREPAPRFVRTLMAADYPVGTIRRGEDGRLVRSTFSVLDHDGGGRLRLWVRIWSPVEPVSIEEYRSLRAACIGWWITLAAVPAVVVGAGVAGLRSDVWLAVLFAAAILMPAAAVMAGVTERRRSAVVALYSEKTRTWVSPRSRGSRLHRVAPHSTAAARAAHAAADEAAIDERMLRRLTRRGGTGAPGAGASGTWEVFLSCADEPGARILALAAVQDSWELRFVGPDDSGSRWMIILERDVVGLGALEVSAARTRFTSLTATVRQGSYDGWQLEN
ncbi:hypothetical protein [Herbiconiux sp.]|uniref:hypothetical protein n=1 Tax=Herbiconiux sp. TaxID=1871186 RepID=UPI0025BAB96D|nr:hypothetical protein [Herbiconiux sp.]